MGSGSRFFELLSLLGDPEKTTPTGIAILVAGTLIFVVSVIFYKIRKARRNRLWAIEEAILSEDDELAKGVIIACQKHQLLDQYGYPLLGEIQKMGYWYDLMGIMGHLIPERNSSAWLEQLAKELVNQFHDDHSRLRKAWEAFTTVAPYHSLTFAGLIDCQVERWKKETKEEVDRLEDNAKKTKVRRLLGMKIPITAPAPADIGGIHSP